MCIHHIFFIYYVLVGIWAIMKGKAINMDAHFGMLT